MRTDLLLVIEVDGFTHLLEETFIKDKKKEKNLERVGFKVLRFNDEEVLNDIKNVTRTIDYWTDKRSFGFNIPPLAPAVGGKSESR